MSDELVEAVAHSLCCAKPCEGCHGHGEGGCFDLLLWEREARAAIAVVIERVERELDKCGEPCPVCHDAIRKLGEIE